VLHVLATLGCDVAVSPPEGMSPWGDL
jgi:hypothetical protein